MLRLAQRRRLRLFDRPANTLVREDPTAMSQHRPAYRAAFGTSIRARRLGRVFAAVGLLLALVAHPTAAQVTPAGASMPAPAQVPGPARTVRIAVLTLGSLEALEPGWTFFVERMGQHGYVEGQNLVFDRRAASGDTAQLPALAADLVAQEPDVIFAAFTPAVVAAKQATSMIPIVMPFGGDPVGSGLIDSFEHPGGNVTGMSDPSAQLMPPLVRRLANSVPGLQRLAVFTSPMNPTSGSATQAARATAEPLGIQVARVDVVAPTDDALDAAFDVAVSQGVQGFVFYYSPTTPGLDRHAAETAAARHLPGIYETRGPVDTGGLMSLTVDYNDSFARAADYVDQILTGADPADLPVGVPDRFQFVINLPAARALGLSIPSTVLDQASEVIR
jgi:putative tryptophan/tyrosine transport system substrate-binding protein